MINNQNGIYNLLKAEPLIPVVAIENYKQLDEIVKSLLERKIFCIEITLRTPFSWQAIERAKEVFKQSAEEAHDSKTITTIQQSRE